MIIGLEIHVQLRTNSKLFCECSADYRSAEPNVNICEVCTSQPGSKPYPLNESAVQNALKIALALQCKVSPEVATIMNRKHYFYPDLPSNYQRTSLPIGSGGTLEGIRIREVHLEEDPGRYDLKSGRVDYNRSGIPLVEIVTDPDFRSPDEARKFLDELQSILEYLQVGREEAGGVRVDANISQEGHSRVEVKNINSFKGVSIALTYEAARQKNLIKNGVQIVQETRHFDEDRNVTLTLRKKETVDDYRHIFDPDVKPILFSASEISQIKKEMPELPSEKRERFRKQYKISDIEAVVLAQEPEIAECFEKVAKKIDAVKAARFMRGVLKKQLNYRTLRMRDSSVTEKEIIELLDLSESRKITEKISEELLIALLDKKIPKGTKIFDYAEKHSLLGTHGSDEMDEAVAKVLKENEKAVQDFKNGNEKALHFLAGQIMKLTKKKADPKELQELLRRKIK